jgi:hypothetical protein
MIRPGRPPEDDADTVREIVARIALGARLSVMLARYGKADKDRIRRKVKASAQAENKKRRKYSAGESIWRSV